MQRAEEVVGWKSRWGRRRRGVGDRTDNKIGDGEPLFSKGKDSGNRALRC